MMDRNAPTALPDTAQRGYDESKALIGKWHGRGRLRLRHHAALRRHQHAGAAGARRRALARVSRLLPAIHISENAREIAWMAELFPERQELSRHLRPSRPARAAGDLGHGIHLDEGELQRMPATGSAVAHCPTSNLFLGSGCFDVARTIGAGRAGRARHRSRRRHHRSRCWPRWARPTRWAQLGGQALSPWQAFYLATRGSAHALYLDDRIGSIAGGWRPTSSCSTSGRRRSSSTAWSSPRTSTKRCSFR